MAIVALAFLAGLLSFLSPCVLPLVPVYIGYLGGAAVTPEGVVVQRREAVFHALAFVLGFTTIFVAIWSALFALTSLIDKILLGQIGGVVLIIFGIHMLGIVRIPFLYRDTRMQLGPRESSYPTSYLTGMAFAAGWTPCIGPTLSGILTLATQTATALQGTALLLVYAAGLGVPFIATAFALETMTRRLKQLRRYMHAVEIISGLLLIGMGILLLTARFQILNTIFLRITPEWLIRLL
jgi:cytochrome c-type biogenesis protein